MNDGVIDSSQCLRSKAKVKDTSRNGFLNVSPANLNFTFNFRNLKVQEKTLKITNYFSKSCPIQPLPIITPYFRFGSAPQTRWLTPGSVHKINIQFIPDEPRNYNDVLKIRYFDDRILIVQITGNVRTGFCFPANINFGYVPLGKAACYEIPICSQSKEQFSFTVLPSKEDPCIDIYPRWGRVRANQKPVIIMVIYRPLRYISMNFQIRIFITDLCKTPYIINFSAYTRPGLLREVLENVKPESKNRKQVSKVGAKTRKKAKATSQEIITSKSCAEQPIMEYKGVEERLLKECGYFPLHALHTVNCVLISKPRTLSNEHELKGPMNIYLSEVVQQKAQKLKEFLTKANNYRRKNVRLRIGCKPKVNNGTRELNEKVIVEIKSAREKVWNDYTRTLENYVSVEDVSERQKSQKMRQRILRIAQKYPKIVTPVSKVEQSFLHYYNIMPFVQAARIIILNNRLLKVLEKLKNLTPELITTFEILPDVNQL
ncbi:uncharacterized protein LOC144468471 [Augochlora pura]